MTPQPPHPCDTCKNKKCPLFAKSGYKPTGNTSQYYSIRWVIEKVGCASHTSAGNQQRIEQADKKLCQLGDMIHAIQYAGKVSAEVINDLDDVLAVYREVREALALLQAGDGK